jgi:hypothetical protein
MQHVWLTGLLPVIEVTMAKIYTQITITTVSHALAMIYVLLSKGNKAVVILFF